ncbi:MAG TPA: metal-dependent hydrolase [bacterium]
MPTPVAHAAAGAGVALIASRWLPAARALPVVAAAALAANLPDLDYLALVGGRAAMERFHQGPAHSLAFIAAATLPLTLVLRRRLGLAWAWALLACAGLTHLLLDLVVLDEKPPVGFPFFWPLSDARFHAPFAVFPGIDRVHVLSMRNLRELLVELALGIPFLLLALRLGRSAGERGAR